MGAFPAIRYNLFGFTALHKKGFPLHPRPEAELAKQSGLKQASNNSYIYIQNLKFKIYNLI